MSTAHAQSSRKDGILFLILSAILFWQGYTLPETAWIFPLSTACIIALAGLLCIIKETRTASAPLPPLKLLFNAAVLLTFWILHDNTGFYSAICLLIFLYYLYFSEKICLRAIVAGVLTALLTTGLLFGLFYKTLNIMTPTGLFF